VHTHGLTRFVFGQLAVLLLVLQMIGLPPVARANSATDVVTTGTTLVLSVDPRTFITAADGQSGTDSTFSYATFDEDNDDDDDLIAADIFKPQAPTLRGNTEEIGTVRPVRQPIARSEPPPDPPPTFIA
jgi:hypothetical protein